MQFHRCHRFIAALCCLSIAMPIQAADQTTDQAADQPTGRAADRTTDQTAEQSTGRAAEQTADQPTGRAADRTADQTAEQPTDRAADRTTDQTTDQGADQPTGRAAIDFSDPPQGVFLDDWVIMSLGDESQRIGYGHSVVSRNGDRIITRNLFSMSMARVGQPVKISILQSTTETLDGKPLKFNTQMDMSVQKMEITGRIEDGRVKMVASQFGVTSQQEYDYPEGALMSWGMLLNEHKHGYAPGTRYTVKAYDPSAAANVALEITFESHERSSIELGGKTVDAIRTTQSMKLPAMPTEVQSEAWVSPDGVMLKSTINLAGMKLLMQRATKAEALADFDPPEFFAPTTITVPEKINRAAARRIEYTLELKDKSGPMPPLPVTDLQKVEPVSDYSVRVNVTRPDHSGLEKAPPVSDKNAWAEYLSPNPIINSDDPEIRKMATVAKRTAETPYATADFLRRYVTEVITEKNLNIGFASASEVCRNREGDCSEHAVLLAALGRACGIPSRIATGMVYVPVFAGEENIFGFHMWTQFYIGDRWVDFDAAQRESICNATHIAFSVDSLSDAGLGQIAFPLVNVIGNLNLKIEKIEPAPID